MKSADPERTPDAQHNGGFPSTHWSLVVAAGERTSPDSDDALKKLCEVYWYPLYAYVRRRMADVHEAQDLLQEFFARLLEKNYIGDAEQERGRFRSFLLTAMKHFLANEWRKNKARKRGGGQATIPWDFANGELQYSFEPVDAMTAERLFERQWALTVLRNVLSRLRDEYAAKGKESQFNQLKGCLGGPPAGSGYAEKAQSLGMTVNATEVAVHRLRRRYGELLRAELAQTVAQPGDVDDEIRMLFAVLG